MTGTVAQEDQLFAVPKSLSMLIMTATAISATEKVKDGRGMMPTKLDPSNDDKDNDNDNNNNNPTTSVRRGGTPPSLS